MTYARFVETNFRVGNFVDRARPEYARDVFRALLNLYSVQPWLKSKDDALYELHEFCENDEQRHLILTLLGKTKFVSETDFADSIDELARQVQNNWNLDYTTTIFFSANENSRAESSKEVLNRFKSFEWEENWDKTKFQTSWSPHVDKIKDGWNVVLVDDFIGTGRSIEKALRWFKDPKRGIPENVKWYVCAVSGCVEGLTRIEPLVSGLRCIHAVRKAISEELPPEDRANANDNMTILEDKLADLSEGGSLDKFRFGFGRSEAMFYRRGGNTPNNVFPIFWWNYLVGQKRKTVMKRT